jgi:hypothetical protein
MTFAEMAMGWIPRVSEQRGAKKARNQAMTMPMAHRQHPERGITKYKTNGIAKSPVNRETKPKYPGGTCP